MSRTKIKAAVAGAAATPNAELSSLRFLQMTWKERRNTRLLPSLLQTKKNMLEKALSLLQRFCFNMMHNAFLRTTNASIFSGEDPD